MPADFPFDNSYARDLQGFYVPWQPTAVAAPKLLFLNHALADELGLDADWLGGPDGAAVFAGNADEPISSLDVSVQASILNLLKDLKVERGTAMLFISHDLAVVGYPADVIAVLFQGHVMEIGPAETIFQSPQHPYTEVLLAAYRSLTRRLGKRGPIISRI